MTPAPLRVLAVTRIFPNRVEPFACAFQRQQLGALARMCHLEVLAGVPYLAGASLLGDRTRPGRLARGVPREDQIDGVPVIHPRVPYVPGTGTINAMAPFNAPLYTAALVPYLKQLRGRFDVVLGTFLYPDACAAAVVARILDLPYAIKAHGTDVNTVAQWPSVRPLVAPALKTAAWAFGVSQPMVDELIRLGARPERAVLLPNGVDRRIFHPVDRPATRRALGLPEDGKLISFVGRLENFKGVNELMTAYERVRAASTGAPTHLVMVGEGSMEGDLKKLAARLDADGTNRGKLVLAGPHPLTEVARYVGASDMLTLPSWNEGTPNVVLESLATGRPVVATRVGGIPDVVDHGRTGLLVPSRDPDALATALIEALGREWDEHAIVASAPPSWDDSAALLHRLLSAAAHRDLREAA